MWRGLVLNRAVQQFLQDAHWGDLDYLLIDLPPGHRRRPDGPGPLLPRTEVIVVTTPPWRPRRWRPGRPTWPARATCGWPGSSRT
jgi:hypothetical protein